MAFLAVMDILCRQKEAVCLFMASSVLVFVVEAADRYAYKIQYRIRHITHTLKIFIMRFEHNPIWH